MNDDEVIAAAFEVMRRRMAGDSGPTVAQLYELYAAAKGPATKSWSIVAGKMRPILETFGALPASQITIGSTEDYRAKRRRTETPRGKGKTYSDLSINFELQWLKCMLTWAHRGGRIQGNPLASMKDAKCKKSRKTSPTEEEIGDLLRECDPLMRAVVLLAADSGMRRDEIRNCEWSWINERERLITLPADATKSQKERRVPVTERTFTALSALPRHLRNGCVFTNPTTGNPYDGTTVDYWFRDIVDASGVQAAPGDGRVRIHDLRHAYARRAARAGVRIEVISLILGHATIQQTLVYLQTGDDDVTDALDTFEQGLRRSPKRAERQIHDVGARALAPNEK